MSSSAKSTTSSNRLRTLLHLRLMLIISLSFGGKTSHRPVSLQCTDALSARIPNLLLSEQRIVRTSRVDEHATGSSARSSIRL